MQLALKVWDSNKIWMPFASLFTFFYFLSYIGEDRHCFLAEAKAEQHASRNWKLKQRPSIPHKMCYSHRVLQGKSVNIRISYGCSDQSDCKKLDCFYGETWWWCKGLDTLMQKGLIVSAYTKTIITHYKNSTRCTQWLPSGFSIAAREEHYVISAKYRSTSF